MSQRSAVPAGIELRGWLPVLARLVAVGAALLVLGLILGLALVGRHGGGPLQGWDDTVWRWSIHHRGHLVGLDKVIGTVGDAALLGPLCLLAGLILLALRRFPAALVAVLSYLGGESLVYLLRAVLHRHRPPTADFPAPGAVAGVHETSYSFPSGHAVAVTAVLFGLLGLLALARRWWWPWPLALLLSAFVADSRLQLGVHWFSDVAIGMVLGVCWGVSVAVLVSGWRPRPPTGPGRSAPPR